VLCRSKYLPAQVLAVCLEFSQGAFQPA